MPLLFLNGEIFWVRFALYGPTLKRPPKMSLNETYFFILLHEIGHFKVKDKVPRYYAKVKRDIEQTYHSPDEAELRLYAVEDYMPIRQGETLEKWGGRLEDFRCWLATGETMWNHVRVDEWALREFLKKRKLIRQLLNRDFAKMELRK